MITPWSQPRMEGISRFAKEHSWNLMMADRLGKFETPESFDGVLMTVRDTAESVAAARRILASGTPAVDLTEERPDIPMPRVASDNTLIGALAAKHFAERGFSQFAWFSSGWTEVHKKRFEGFKNALPPGAEIVRWNARAIASTLKNAPRPVAALAYNDADAARLVNACREAGCAVPGDVAILGIGNDPFLCENQATTISSIEQNLVQNAYEGAAELEKLIRASPDKRRLLAQTPVPRTAPGDVVQRESSNTLAHPDPQIRAAFVCIHKNLARSIGAQEIAAEMGIARHTLDRLFAHNLHRSVGSEILRQRIIRAKRLLRDKQMLVKQIASLCGFCNTAHLTNVFRRETGRSPLEWRKLVVSD